jgi:ankyrin repeat protein
MKIGRMAGLGLILAVLASPVAAQLGSDGEKFLDAVRKSDGNAATELINAPGSTVVNYRGYQGDTGLIIAAGRRDYDWLAFLLSKGADPNTPGAGGDTALISASRIGFGEGVLLLLKVRAKVDLANKLGETPLIVAVQQRHSEIVRYLLESGANPDKADHAAGYSARDYAKQDRRSNELLKLIESVKPVAKASTGPSIK